MVELKAADTDLALVSGVRSGDESAMARLYDKYSSIVYSVALRVLGDTGVAEDVLQEGFLKIFNSIKSFRFESSLTTWMTRIMINMALNQQRQKLYLLPMVDVEEAGLQEDEKISLADFHLAELIMMVQSLPDGCRVVFNLFAIEGYGHKEIGEMLGISEGTSKSQYNRAKSLLRSKLEHVKKNYAKLGEIGI